MGISVHEIKTYSNFDALASDVLTLAKEILPDKFIYINSLADNKQTTLKVSENHPVIPIREGLTIHIEEGLCNRVDFISKKPLIYENIPKEKDLDAFANILKSVHIDAYMGIPISLDSGERFGTLCIAHNQPTHFDEKSVKLLEKIARMFSYYLEVEHIAYIDVLTGIFNRQYLRKFFDSFKGTHGALYFIDLDGFKKVNDTYGHETGDLILKEVGQKLTSFTQDCEIAYPIRLGGDEFVVCIPNLSRNYDIDLYAKKMLKVLSHFETPIQDTSLSASIGVSTYQANSKLDYLLSLADQALYQAKIKKNTYIINKAAE